MSVTRLAFAGHSVTMGLPIYPFDAQRYVGTVSQVGPTRISANAPNAAEPGGVVQHGYRFGVGEVGEFVAIECGEIALVGRVLEVRLPERERLAVEPDIGPSRDVNPVSTIQLLTSISLQSGEVSPGVGQYPRIGAKVYSLHPELLKWLFEAPKRSAGTVAAVTLELVGMRGGEIRGIGITPEYLFGRHCAVIGATGGGKSWSVARIVEQCARYRSKVFLFDATGEYFAFDSTYTRHRHIGVGASKPGGSLEVVLPYSEMTEGDLFAMFRPSGQSQAPKLRAAIRSLKVARCEPSLAPTGVVRKADQQKKPFEDAYRKHVKVVEGPKAEFDIEQLSRQIEEECVWPTSNRGQGIWGGVNNNEVAYCVTLQTRIDEVIHSKELASVFSASGKLSLIDEIEKFLKDDSQQVFRLSLQSLPFANNAREIVANAIGRHFLELARGDKFKDAPVLLVLDEAHQFLNKTVGDENSRLLLDAFALIAKEGRKYGVSVCIATQRPRDIPEDVLSQMGTLLVHRLVNDHDRRVVERAAGEIDRTAADFLPTLGPGEAVLVGVDFPVPLTVRVEEPEHRPDSSGPDFQRYWGLAGKPPSKPSSKAKKKSA